MIFAEGLLKGKVALVTGGATGIGYGIAEAFARYGADVAIASRKLERLEAKAGELRRFGGRVLPVQVDVRDSAAVDAMIARVVDELGGLDILVNNAAGNFFAPSVAMSDNAFNSVVGIDLYGTFYCSRAAGRVMMEHGGGRIMSIVATLAERGFPGMVHMTSAKAGIEAMTKTLAAEWGEFGIRVNAISPGPIQTEGVEKAFMMSDSIIGKIAANLPVGRFGRPDEVANVAVFLASPAGDFVTGTTWKIDGGESLGANMMKMVAGGE
jgi:peroxisomal 2,4-dienoyl-CoA reductase